MKSLASRMDKSRTKRSLTSHQNRQSKETPISSPSKKFQNLKEKAPHPQTQTKIKLREKSRPRTNSRMRFLSQMMSMIQSSKVSKSRLKKVS